MTALETITDVAGRVVDVLRLGADSPALAHQVASVDAPRLLSATRMVLSACDVAAGSGSTLDPRVLRDALERSLA